MSGCKQRGVEVVPHQAEPFSIQDLTVIIPTVGRGALLVRLIEHLVDVCLVKRIIVVWDSEDRIPDDLSCLPQEVCVIRHERNRGLSAARNTGLRALQTRLGMFIDDDILPCRDLAEFVVGFHNNFSGPLVFGMGLVTWEGTGLENVLTRWFETMGNWSIFGKMIPGQKYPFFMGGFTSFKTVIRDSLLFDETFTRYGCEDVEFGFRLFSLGGELRMIDGLRGLHYSKMDVDVYTRNHLGAGYSKGVMFRRHPDAAFSPEYFSRFLRIYAGRKCSVDIANAVSAILSADVALSEDINSFMQLLTDAAMAEGLYDYCAENYDGFAEAAEFLCTQSSQSWSERLMAAVEICPSHAMLWRLAAEEVQRSGGDWHPLLWKCVATAPTYIDPLLCLHADGGEDGQRAEKSLRALWENARTQMAPEVARRIPAALGPMQEGDEGGASGELSVREMFFELRQRAHDRNRVIELASAILEREISHVGAALTLAEALQDEEPGLAITFAALAEHFLTQRPLHEHQDVQRRIGKIRDDIGRGKP
ncbi:MAG: glycosyltransferase family 2 protein [Bacteroidales bacterium]